jgi:hypothetical protein
LEFAQQHENIKPYVVRAGGVLGANASSLQPVLGCLLPTVSVETLGKVMADLAVNGGSSELVQNKDILERGKELVAERK